MPISILISNSFLLLVAVTVSQIPFIVRAAPLTHPDDTNNNSPGSLEGPPHSLYIPKINSLQSNTSLISLQPSEVPKSGTKTCAFAPLNPLESQNSTTRSPRMAKSLASTRAVTVSRPTSHPRIAGILSPSLSEPHAASPLE